MQGVGHHRAGMRDQAGEELEHGEDQVDGDRHAGDPQGEAGGLFHKSTAFPPAKKTAGQLNCTVPQSIAICCRARGPAPGGLIMFFNIIQQPSRKCKHRPGNVV